MLVPLKSHLHWLLERKSAAWNLAQICQFEISLRKKLRNQRSNWQHLLDHQKSTTVPENHLFLLYWLCQRLIMWITTGVQPQQDPGVPSGWTALAKRERERERERERKEFDIPWFTQKANKAPTWDLLSSWRPEAPSRCGEGAEHLLERVLEARAGKWTQRASALQRINLKKKEKEREREGKNDTGRPSFGEQGPSLYFQRELLYPELYIEKCRVSSTFHQY